MQFLLKNVRVYSLRRSSFYLFPHSWYNKTILKKLLYLEGVATMPTSKAQKKRNRKIIWYLVLIVFTIVQGFLLSDDE